MSSRIEDYAIISDCHTGALVGGNGSIDWLCWPRFDSGACFAALLGMPEHGRWRLGPADPAARTSRSYRGATNVLETRFETADGTVVVVDFMPVGEEHSTVVRRVFGRGGRVAMTMELGLRFDYGRSTPSLAEFDGGMSALVGPNLVTLHTPCRLTWQDGTVVADFTLGEGDVMDFALSWGLSHEPPPGPVDCATALEATVTFWSEWAARSSYDGAWSEPVLRSLLTLKALTYAPTGGIVAALTTSLPEWIGSPRNWDYRYCWLRDATLTLVAFMANGYQQEAKDWFGWLHRAVAGSPDEVQIMYGLSGKRILPEWSPDWLPGYERSAPVRVGNAAVGQVQHDVAGEVIGVFQLARQYGLVSSDWSSQVKFVEHLIKIWEQPDEGIWEVRGGKRQYTWSKIMEWLALDRSVRDAEQEGAEAPLERWREERARMHADICARGFDPVRNAFTQSYGRPELDASLLLLPLTGFLPADDKRVQGTLAAIERELVVDGLVQRYRANEDSGEGLPPGEGAFLACSFWLVQAYVAAGRLGDAKSLFARLIGLANDVGLLAEEYDPQAGRQLGNFPQAFSHLALVMAALSLDGRDGGRYQGSASNGTAPPQTRM